jgi:hypothetical protein
MLSMALASITLGRLAGATTQLPMPLVLVQDSPSACVIVACKQQVTASAAMPAHE